MSSGQSSDLSNGELAREVIQACWQAGCREFVVCAGSRNSPLVLELLNLEQTTAELKIWNFFEERSAAFFALGRAKKMGMPAAVVTTSGTAVAELLPAVIEAHYSDVPMILVTADRPKRFNASGAPQTIDQKGITSPFTEINVDVNVGDVEGLELLNKQKASNQRWHINARFDEPLLSGMDGDEYSLSSVQDQFSDSNKSIVELTELEAFIEDRSDLVILSGYLRPDQRSSELIQWLKHLGCPIWAEASSGLRENALLSGLIIRSGDRFFAQNPPSKVLRIGDVPSLRFWRDLETLEKIEVLSISPPSGYPGLGRDSKVLSCDFPGYLQDLSLEADGNKPDLTADREIWKRMLTLLEKYPQSEPAWMNRLSGQIPSGSLVFLGNSMPIREWNLAGSYEGRDLRCFASRGANGIDGQLSTFLGLSANETESWGLFGDLTILYDMSAPWVLDQLESGKRRIVVINNGGGRIFSRLPHLADLPEENKRVTENHHQISFEHWAAMWGLGYQRLSDADELSLSAIEEQESVVIELCPDLEQTEAFWREYNTT